MPISEKQTAFLLLPESLVEVGKKFKRCAYNQVKQLNVGHKSQIREHGCFHGPPTCTQHPKGCLHENKQSRFHHRNAVHVCSDYLSMKIKNIFKGDKTKSECKFVSMSFWLMQFQKKMKNAAPFWFIPKLQANMIQVHRIPCCFS